jgi:LmbE family N-acetylglucosaminyl deacetylase
MGALNRTQSLPIHGKNILLVIAHPDDEVMFFGPTLIGITNSSSENNVRVLCLSNGISVIDKVDVRKCRRIRTYSGARVSGQFEIFWNRSSRSAES